MDDRAFDGTSLKIEYQPDVGLIIGKDVLLLYVDSSCHGNGTPDAKASVGMYAGPGHPMSKGYLLSPSQGRLTNQTAELHALMSGVRSGMAILLNSDTDISPDPALKVLVIASDSAYACGGITRWIEKWRPSGFENVQNAYLFKQLDDLVIQAATVHGISIRFWQISREMNEKADGLARCVLEDEEQRREELHWQWRPWLQSVWYGDIVSFLLFG